MARDFHRRPFDDATLEKLALFRAYIREWLPVWISQSGTGPISIVDFFAGPGKDENGVAGTPMIALHETRQWSSALRSGDKRVRLLLNEGSVAKARALRELLEAEDLGDRVCDWEVASQRFEEYLPGVWPKLTEGPSLLLLDQQGMKEISDEVFGSILSLARTDFLFFIASSSIRRFETHPYFQRHLKIPKGSIRAAEFNDTHRAVAQYYRSMCAERGYKHYIGQFSIKKGSNLYGLIFGSGHPLGLEKFLRTCWKADPERGEANFDIDRDRIDRRKPHLFADMDIPSKCTEFRSSLRERILQGTLRTDRDVYLEALQEGFLPTEAREVLRELVKSRHVRAPDGRPRVSKDGFKEPRRLEVADRG